MRKRQNSSALLLLLVALLLFAFVIYRMRGFLRAPQQHDAPVAARSFKPRLGPADIYPDPPRTPGAVDPDITQANIQDTICNPRWSTKSIRPPEHYTHELKIEQIREYGYADTDLRDYEEDHLIPLELGGDPTDPKNLWPEPFETSIPDGGAHAKDRVESYLHRQVCAGRLTLDEARRAIATDWYRVYIADIRAQ
jgi:hypothetical protein